MKPNILIIDYDMGNIKSVHNSFNKMGAKVKTSNTRKDIKKADALILPGVGAFAKAMQNLESLNLIDPIVNFAIEKKKPILGICLGMQLLAESSAENGFNEGLSLIPGNVKPIKRLKGLRLPHIGWNELEVKTESPLFNGIVEDSFYFVHSYYFKTKKKNISATVDYGYKITSAVQNENIFGVQFHPEKSQTGGMKLISNFITLISKGRY